MTERGVSLKHPPTSNKLVMLFWPSMFSYFTAHVFLRDSFFKVLVVREPFNPRSSEAFTPVILESGPHKDVKEALRAAKAACAYRKSRGK